MGVYLIAFIPKSEILISKIIILTSRNSTMNKKVRFFVILFFLAIGSLSSASASTVDGAIDSTNAYAWGENVGWLNLATSQGDVHVTNSSLSGYIYGENTGWISLNCSNTSSCATVDYKVANTVNGDLSGYGWGENVGWIDFNPSGGGVGINGSGTFSGLAYGENIGWIVFNCGTTGSCATVDYKVQTEWRPACNNGLDDDGDTKTDWPNDAGCENTNDGTEGSDVGGGTGGGGGGGGGIGLGGGGYESPVPPADGFSVTINGGNEETDSRTVLLDLSGGPNTTRMLISNFSDFHDAEIELYVPQKEWVILDDQAGEKQVYVKFLTQYAGVSDAVYDAIIYTLKIGTQKETVTPPQPPLTADVRDALLPKPGTPATGGLPGEEPVLLPPLTPSVGELLPRIPTSSPTSPPPESLLPPVQSGFIKKVIEKINTYSQYARNKISFGFSFDILRIIAIFILLIIAIISFLRARTIAKDSVPPILPPLI